MITVNLSENEGRLAPCHGSCQPLFLRKVFILMREYQVSVFS